MDNKSQLLGPCGGNGGNYWDDGVHNGGLREISLVYGGCIDSIQLTYAYAADDNNIGKLFPAEKHGGMGGTKSAHDNSMRMGACGGIGGDSWDDGVHSGVREVTLVYGWCIDSIQVTYDHNGKLFLGEKHGGTGGTKLAQINIQFPEEILISISGHYHPLVYGGGHVIRSLTFKTNRRTYGPFGIEEGTSFNFLTNGRHIVGFHGRSGWFLDSLGLYLSTPKPCILQTINKMFKGFNPLAIRK